MSDKDIFTETNSGVQTDTKENEPLNLDVFADKLLSIKKEDGSPKYDSLEKALDALKASQEHIPTLEQDNKSLREKNEELTKAAARAAELEEIVRRMTNGENNNEEKPKVETPSASGLSEQDAAKLVRDILNQERQVDVAKTNIMTVQNKLVEKFGDKVQDVLKAKATELNTSLDKLKELAAQSPAMVLALFGDTTSSPAPTTSSVMINGLPKPDTTVQRPEKSILSGTGATDKNRVELMRKIKEEVYRKNGITT